MAAHVVGADVTKAANTASAETATATATAFHEAVAPNWQPWSTVPRDDMDVLAKVDDFYQVVFWDAAENTGWHVADADIRYSEGFFTHWRRDCLGLAPAAAAVSVTTAMVNAAFNEAKSRRMTGLPSDFRAVLEVALAAHSTREAGHG
jgi:hypothetical protein